MASLSDDKLKAAQRFEDEKRRIIESCFSKREDDGTGQYFDTLHSASWTDQRPQSPNRILRISRSRKMPPTLRHRLPQAPQTPTRNLESSSSLFARLVVLGCTKLERTVTGPSALEKRGCWITSRQLSPSPAHQQEARKTRSGGNGREPRA